MRTFKPPRIGGRASPNTQVMAVVTVEEINADYRYRDEHGTIVCADASCKNLITPTMRLVLTYDAWGSTLLLCDDHLED